MRCFKKTWCKDSVGVEIVHDFYNGLGVVVGETDGFCLLLEEFGVAHAFEDGRAAEEGGVDGEFLARGPDEKGEYLGVESTAQGISLCDL